MTTNQIAYWRLEEDKRANRAKESENAQHNRATEREQTLSRRMTDEHYQRQDSVNLQSMLNLKTHQDESRAETERSNLAKETETYRSNLEKEAATRSTIAEQQRHNLRQETISGMTLAETSRANKAKEEISKTQADAAVAKVMNDSYMQRHTMSMDKQKLALDTQKLSLEEKNAAVKRALDTSATVHNYAKTGKDVADVVFKFIPGLGVVNGATGASAVAGAGANMSGMM